MAEDKKQEAKEEEKETTKKTTTKKNTTKKTNTKKSKTESKTKTNKSKENIDKVAKATSTAKKARKRDMDELIRVVCITNTPLVYVSKNQVGYRVDWGGFLEENWIEYRELINMRNSQRAFFEQPWIICDWEVLEDLKVDQYYKNIIDLENLDKVFHKSPEELEKTLKIVPEGIRKLIMDRAFEMVRNKELDSLSTIKVIEKTLNVDLEA
jgi:hypothetical protein